MSISTPTQQPNHLAPGVSRPYAASPLIWFAVLSFSCFALFPGVAGAAKGSIDDCQYPDAAAAQAEWKALRGSASADVASVDGRQVLRLPCNFAGTTIQRAGWDRQVSLDLTTSRGIEFQVLCREAAPVSHFSFYFQSGEGWYSASFFPESSTGWNTVRLDKSAFGTEGKPAGWGQIQTIRLAAWRAQDANTEFLVRDFRPTGELGVDALVAVVRGESVAQRDSEEGRSVAQFTESIVQRLQELDLGGAVISDLDLNAQRLSGAKVVILPHNPQMPERAADALFNYVQGGGKLIAFYSVPAKLQPLLKVESGGYVRPVRPGFFSTIRVAENALPGAPERVSQRSWNIHSFQPAADGGRTLAEWLDDRGQPTGHAAILGSANGLVMTHVLLDDDVENKRRLLLAMVGQLAPELWEQSLEASIGRVGVIGNAKSLEELAAAIAKLAPENPRATQALNAARASRDSALQAAAKKDFGQGLDHAAAASRQVNEAWCLAQPSLPGEFRAFWCHSAFGVSGMSWDEAIRRLAENGFTAIFPNLLWGGVAYYDSKVLPVSPEVAKRGDQIAECLAAARKYGLQVHVWKVNWKLGHAAPKEVVTRLSGERRLQQDAQGKEEPWLCPSHPANQQLEIDSLLEVARNYDLDGLHFDYIRYPGNDHCFCEGCQERFQKSARVTLQNWPKDVLSAGPLREQWLDWRRGNIDTVVRSVSEQVRALKPKLKISAAVFPNWPAHRDSIGQDWKLWCDRGWLDFVCPMDYTNSHRQFENLVSQQVQWAGRVPVYPGIGASASSSRLSVDGVIEQIHVTRQHHTGGFIIFNYGVSQARELAPMLGLGITSER